MFSQAIMPSSVPSADPLGVLNAVSFAPVQIEGALEAVAMLPLAAQRDPVAQSLALQKYARDTGIGEDAAVSAALHARVAALAKWTAAHDPNRQSSPDAIIAAAAHFPLVSLSNGIGFEPAGFQEMILFIEELPW
jgi:hypothetical protein